MNGTFTIESVHGVKQTIVLAPSGTVDATVSPADKRSDQDRKEMREDSDAKRPR